MSPAGAISFLLLTHMFVIHIQLHWAIAATPWEAEWNKVQDDALMTLKSKLSLTALKADADALAKFEAFKLDKDISFSSFKDPLNLQTNTWFTFSTKLTLNIQRGSKWSALNGCTFERTKQPYQASGNLKIDPASNELVYEKEKGIFKPGAIAFGRTDTKIGWPERKSSEYVNCDKDHVQDYAERLLKTTLDRIAAKAFTEALRKLQWKDGPTRVNGLSEIVMKDLITKHLGKEPFALETKRAPYWLNDYDCAWSHDLAFDKVVPAGIAKRGDAILVTVEFSKVKFACVSKNGDRSRGIDIPTLMLTVKFAPDAGKADAKPFALKCEQVADDQSESASKGNSRLAKLTKTLKDKYTYDLCAFVVEMGGTSWSNFPALRDKYNRYYSQVIDNEDIYLSPDDSADELYAAVHQLAHAV